MGESRNVANCPKKWDNLKQEAKKKYSFFLKESKKTGYK
jgi:hypothetical protein